MKSTNIKREILLPTDKEWLDSNPEGMKEMVNDKLAELYKEKTRLQDEIVYQTEESLKKPTEEWLRDLIADWIEQDLKNTLKQIRKFQTYKKHLEPSADRITDYDIEQARAYPLENLIPGKPQPGGSGKIKYTCPFHSEKTASFFVYVEQNRYVCFSCNEKGNAIDFVMKKNGLDFIEAVKMLKN